MAGWFRRSVAGWALIALSAALALFYAHVVRVALTGRSDEAYLRTFVTGEFAVYPQSTAFRPGDGLAYEPGTVADMAEGGRRYLARFDWWRAARPRPLLRKPDGRLFLSIPPAQRRPDRPHRLILALTCAYPAGQGARLAVTVNGTAAAEAACAQGPVRIEATLPPGVLGAQDYEEIRIARPGLGWRERLAIRFGLRFDAVALDRFSIARE